VGVVWPPTRCSITCVTSVRRVEELHRICELVVSSESRLRTSLVGIHTTTGRVSITFQISRPGIYREPDANTTHARPVRGSVSRAGLQTPIREVRGVVTHPPGS